MSTRDGQFMSRSENMSRVKAAGTSIEKMLRRELWARGYRYRKNYRKVFGNPDIVFIKRKVAVFCDSEFWHGKDYLEGKNIPKSNNSFWVKKLQKNIARDIQVNERLKSEGWTVIRIWAKEIRRDVSACADLIEKALE
jgi:DNA mismatch endonuclease Vsr